MLGIFGFYYVHFMNRVFYLLCIMLFLAVSCRKKQVILTQRYSIVAEKKPVVRLEHSDSITKSECLITTDGYQLPNSDFRQWHRVDCNRGSYEQIGVSQQDIWTITNSSYDNPCSNLPNQAKSTSDFCSSVPKAAMITTTVNNNFQDKLTGKNIVAGMLLTGKLDNSNKLELGVVYSGTPIAFSFTYKYKPGNFFHDNWGLRKICKTPWMHMLFWSIGNQDSSPKPWQWGVLELAKVKMNVVIFKFLFITRIIINSRRS